MAGPELRLLKSTGPALEDYTAQGGYSGLATANRLGAAWIVGEVEQAGLRGRGGAFFPVAKKWQAALAIDADRVVIANSAEDEPGSLKDQELIRRNVHLVVEGALICAVAVGARSLYFYTSDATPHVAAGIRHALDELRRSGLAPGSDLDVAVVSSPATYVAGEDSSAVSFIESGNALPRSKPPFPAMAGVDGRPTVVNNAETLAHVAMISRKGAAWFRGLGTPSCPGTMLVTVPSNCRRPGVFEVSIGTTIGEAVLNLGGGSGDGDIRGVQVGGPGSGWIADLNVPLAPEAIAAAGGMLGCGAMRVLTEADCAVYAVSVAERFFAQESCGQCPPCRMVTQFADRCVAGVAAGLAVTDAQLDNIGILVEQVTGAVRCALPKFLVAPVATARRLFAEDFAAHAAGASCGRTNHRAG